MALVWVSILCLLSLSLAISPPFRNVKRATSCTSDGQIADIATTALPMLSPDPADTAYRTYEITFTATLAAVTKSAVLDAELDTQPYGMYWPGLSTIPFTSTDYQTYTATVNGTAPTQIGVYHLQFTVHVDSVVSMCFNITIEVSCSAAVTNWCDGERRYIQSSVGAAGKCVTTYKPCGIETAVGVPQTNMCYVYPCFPDNKTCGTNPIGPDPSGQPCVVCTPNPQASCTPSCVNSDGSTRVCGDDTCGGVCGPNTDQTANGCPASGTNTLCGPLGTCVATVPGACGSPYPLFGNSLNPGDTALNPEDKDGIIYFNLNNNSTDTTDPVNKVTASNRAAYGWPEDQFTVPIGGIRVRIFFNAIYYPDSVTPFGNSPNTPDVVFKFTIPPTTAVQSMEAYVLAQDGTVTSTDTFMSLLQEDCTDFTYNTPPITAPDIFSSDDASPPGGISSHIYVGQLTPGTYLIDPTLYSAVNAGPLWFEVVFTDATHRNCPPICSGHFCGSNGCGGVCNVQFCQSPLTCHSTSGRCSRCPNPIPTGFQYNCQVTNFTNNCLASGTVDPAAPYGQSYTRECGEDSDLCGGTCGPLNGACPTGEVCQLETGLCKPVPTCDLFVPICTDPQPVKPGQYFCNSQCGWTELNDPLPDIIPDTQDVILDSMIYHWRNFDDTSCAFQEQCIESLGWNLLLRFDTNIHNQGTIAYWAPSPFARPDLLAYATCHQHYHENGFAYYYLGWTENSTIALQSLKRSYCVETSGASQTGPKNPCTSASTCCAQGLEPGNFDSYNADLDCQWLGVNSLNAMGALGRWFLYTVSVNQHQAVVEYSTLNNHFTFPLYLPCPPAQDTVIVYRDYVSNNPDVCCGRPGGPDSDYCASPPGGCYEVSVPDGCGGPVAPPTPPTYIGGAVSGLGSSCFALALSLLAVFCLF